MTDTFKMPEKPLGRNEPCPCGSGKKFKRCHGMESEPLFTPQKIDPNAMRAALPPGGIPGMEGMDPEAMMQVAQMIQRLPKGQLQRLQGLMQKAMSGKDVSQEAAEFEHSLPPDFQEMMKSMQGKLPAMGLGTEGGMPDMGAMGAQMGELMKGMTGEGGLDSLSSSDSPETMSVDDARSIVLKAAAEGKISKEQAEELLKMQAPAVEAESPQTGSDQSAEEKKSAGISRFFRRKEK